MGDMKSTISTNRDGEGVNGADVRRESGGIVSSIVGLEVDVAIGDSSGIVVRAFDGEAVVNMITGDVTGATVLSVDGISDEDEKSIGEAGGGGG
jgi:hypothetical protein